MPTTIEERRRRLQKEIEERFKSIRRFAKTAHMSPSRVSRALNPEKTSDRRLAPIERALWAMTHHAPLPDQQGAPAPGTPEQQPGTEYRVVPAYGSAEEQTEQLNRLAREGWALVAATSQYLYLSRLTAPER